MNGLKAIARSVEPIDANRTPLFMRSHINALAQSMISYWIGIVFAVIAVAGLVWAGFLTDDVPIGWQSRVLMLLLLSGLIGVMSILVLLHSSLARSLVVLILDRLRGQRNVEDGIALASQISDCDRRNRVYAAIALRLCEVEHSDSIAGSVMHRSPARIPRRSLGKFVIRRS